LAEVPSTKLLIIAFGGYLDKPVDASYINGTEIELSEEEVKEYAGVFTEIRIYRIIPFIIPTSIKK